MLGLGNNVPGLARLPLDKIHGGGVCVKRQRGHREHASWMTAGLTIFDVFSEGTSGFVEASWGLFEADYEL